MKEENKNMTNEKIQSIRTWCSHIDIVEALDALEQTLKENKKLKDVINEYNNASQKFINKVDNGLARSKETYNDLKTALYHAQEID